MSADIVLTEDTLRYISLFEQITKANAIDCMETEEKLVFVVEKGQSKPPSIPLVKQPLRALPLHRNYIR